MPGLFDCIKIGSIEASNRVIMAPLTRARATRDGVPTDIMATYYEQRASAGLIISEGTGINRTGLGWPYAPGIWNQEQVDKWKSIVEAVHIKGGKIISQLWHMGRATHSNITGETPVSASATSNPEPIHTYDGKKDPETAHVLTVTEIKAIVEDYRLAARNAIEAGFDGVQVLAANGYLIDQFLCDSSNLRTDEYGGSIENRVRLLREIVEAVVNEVGPERTSVRLSPNGDCQGVIDSNPEQLFVTVAKLLNKYKVSMLELRENSPGFIMRGYIEQDQLHGPIREVFDGILVLNQGYDVQSGEKAIRSGIADAISYGRPFISNPDLVAKFKNGTELLPADDMSTWYSQGPEGYVDFPTGTP